MIGQPHRVPELRSMHDLRAQARLGLERPAELAVQTAPVVEVYPLANQRRPPAPLAAFAVGVAAPRRATNQRDLKFGIGLIWVFGIPHPSCVRRGAGGSCRRRL